MCQESPLNVGESDSGPQQSRSWYYFWVQLKRVMRKLLLATNNMGKLEELFNLLADLEDTQLLSPGELNLSLEVEEDGSTYRENAELKARAFSQASGLICLADDSGLELEALHGAPGLFSARYSAKKGATAADRRQFLLENLQGHDRPWKARFVSTVCLVNPDGEVHFAEGQCLGEIIPDERGSGGFGYDPIFRVALSDRTMAELSMAEKNQLSHRAQAIMEIKRRLTKLGSAL